jgi:hypothetical protein
MTVDLAALARLASEATPGPWGYLGDVETPALTIATDPYAEVSGRGGPGAWPRNAAYIAAASPDVVAALVRVALAAKDLAAHVETPCAENSEAVLSWTDEEDRLYLVLRTTLEDLDREPR